MNASHSFLKRILKILEAHLKEERNEIETNETRDRDSRFIQDLEKCQSLSLKVLNELENSGTTLNEEEMELFTSVFQHAMKEIKSCPTAPLTH